MWTWRRRAVRVEVSDVVSTPGVVPVAGWFASPCCCCCFRDAIATRSCCTNRETEKVLSVSMMATQESLPPRDKGRIAVAVKR